MIKPIAFNSSINFKAYHCAELEQTNLNTYGQLNHYSAFFRYDHRGYSHADEYLITLMRKKAQKKPVNIVSVGCSFGEEAYSFAMGLEKHKNNVQISAFDISKLAINEAKNGIYSLDDAEYNYLFANLSDYDCTRFRKEMADSFSRNFTHLDAQTFQLKRDCLNNCKFFNADVKQISRFFMPDSQDMLLCRYVLYHLTPQETNIALKQMFNIIKPGGYLALNQDEYKTYQNLLRKNGFKQTNILKPWLFQKPKNYSDLLKDIKEKLRRKSNFNDIE